MRNLFVITLFSFLISSCDYVAKTKQIVDFTPNLDDIYSTKSVEKVLFAKATKVYSWTNAINIANEQPENILVENLDFSKFKSTNLGIKFRPVISRVIASDDAFFILDVRGGLHAFAIDDLKRKWSISLTDNFLSKKYSSGGIVYQDGILYSTYGARDVVAIDASTGLEKWRKSMDDIIKISPAVSGDILYVMSVGNKLIAMSSNDGSKLWQKSDVQEIMYYGNNFSPFTYKENLYMTNLSGVISVFNKEKGDDIWSKDLVEDFDYTPGFDPMNFTAQSIIDGLSLYSASPVGNLLKMSNKDGDICWSKNIEDIQVMNHSQSSLFVVTNGREAAAIDKKSGGLQWSAKLFDENKKKKDVVHYSIPLMVNNKLHIASSEGKLFVISPNDGVIESEIKIPSGCISHVIVGDRYFIFTDQGKIFHN